MRALYPVIGAGAVGVCLQAPEAAPLWIRAPWLRPHAFFLYMGPRGARVCCNAYAISKWLESPSGLDCLSRINMCVDAVRSCSDTDR